MRDDIDRSCCQQFQQVLTDNIPDGWRIKKTDFNDPGMTLTFEHGPEAGVGNPVVSIIISYGESYFMAVNRK